MADTSGPMKAYLPRVHKVRLSRLLLVEDPTHDELVAVWWHLDRPRRWRCSVHGWAAPQCAHVAAARPVLAEHLGLRDVV